MEDEIENIELKSPNSRKNVTRNSAGRQTAVNFMPSRQLPHSTLRLRRVNSERNALLEDDAPDAAEKQADIIVREMEQRQKLMEDNPVSEELRREALRDLPQGLTIKRNIRAKLSASVSLRSKSRPISMYKRLKYRISFAWKRLSDRFKNLVFSIELWYEPIRNIEGHLGSAVGSYFHLLQWLFGLNVLLTAMFLSFIVVPQILHDETHPLNKSISFLDVISGLGGLEDSLLFYGHYHDGDISTVGSLKYNMPFAYFFTMVCVYLALFAVLCYRTMSSYRRNFIQLGGGAALVFAARVFCGWDFSVLTRRAAQLNAASLYHEFKELLSEQNKNQVTRTFCMRFGQRLANIVVTGAVLVFIAGLEYGVWRLLSVDRPADHWEIYVSLVITAVLTICPLLFSFIVKFEFYGPRTAFYVTLARTWLLDISTFMLLFVYWARSGTKCWETSFGQEMYRLVIFDTLVSLLFLPAVEITRGFIYNGGCVGSAPAFGTAYNSLSLVRAQSLVWLGGVFGPLLAALAAAKLLLLFYVKKEVALRMCHPATKVWRAAQTQAVLYMLVTLSLFATLFATGSLFLSSSSACGPFAESGVVWSVLSARALRLGERPALRSALAFLTRPGAIAFILLALCVMVYYARAKSQAQRSMVAILRQMLVLQAQDKDFLLSAIEKVSNGEWLYSPKPEDAGNDSHTWRYLNEVRKPSNAGFHFDASRLSHSFGERPHSYAKENRPQSYQPEKSKSNEDGDTDSSFSWQGSNSHLNPKE